MLNGTPMVLKSLTCAAMFKIFLTSLSDLYALSVGVAILASRVAADAARYLFTDYSLVFEARFTMYDWVDYLESIVAASASILNDDRAIPAAVIPTVIWRVVSAQRFLVITLLVVV